MDAQLIEISLQLINERLLNDPTNQLIVLEKLQFLHNFPEIPMTRILDEFKNLDFSLLTDGYFHHFYHAWGLNGLNVNFDHIKNFYNFHVSLIGNRIVEIHNISTTFNEMNPDQFYYIGVVFGPQVSCRINTWITNERSICFIRDIQTNYSHWFHFPNAEDRFITKSLVGVEEHCQICASNENLENCVAVRNGRCNHAFHRICIEEWFRFRGLRICPYCRINHDEN